MKSLFFSLSILTATILSSLSAKAQSADNYAVLSPTFSVAITKVETRTRTETMPDNLRYYTPTRIMISEKFAYDTSGKMRFRLVTGKTDYDPGVVGRHGFDLIYITSQGDQYQLFKAPYFRLNLEEEQKNYVAFSEGLFSKAISEKCPYIVELNRNGLTVKSAAFACDTMN